MKLRTDHLLWVALPLFNTLNQVFMKMTAGVVSRQAFGLDWLLQAMQAPYIWLSFGCEIVNFIVWLAILKRHHLSEAFPLTAVSYALLMAVSWGFFHEPMQLRQLAGVAVIIAGIALLGFKRENS